MKARSAWPSTALGLMLGCYGLIGRADTDFVSVYREFCGLDEPQKLYQVDFSSVENAIVRTDAAVSSGDTDTKLVNSLVEGLETSIYGCFSSAGTDCGRLGGPASIVQRADYKDYASGTNPTRHGSPKGLIFSRFRSAPGYAKVGVMVVLGGLASILINESGIRGFRNRLHGDILFAGGILCIGIIFCAALMFS